jgi:hypothetical protein
MSATRLTCGDLFADVLRIRHAPYEEVWVYIIQRHGSPDVLGMGTCHTQTAAKKLAEEVMRDLQTRSDAAAAS